MKIAVSVPDDVFERADAFAVERGVSRSQVYAEALRDYLDRESGDADPVTARLDAVAAETNHEVSATAARRLIDDGLWEW